MTSAKPNVLIASSEVRPLAQTGGLAEVAGSLPGALAALGARPAVIMPAYQAVLNNRAAGFRDTGVSLAVPQAGQIIEGRLLRGELTPGVPVHLVACDPFFDRPGLYGYGGLEYGDNPERFAFFCQAVLAALPHLDRPTDIILANDWQTGLLMPQLLELGLDRPRGVFVIHNMGYLGLAPPGKWPVLNLPASYNNFDGLEYFGQISLLKAGLVFSRALVTVSPSYAREVQTPEGGHGLDGTMRHHAHKLTGILNGVDYQLWNPGADPFLPANYDAGDLSGKRVCKKELLAEMGLPPAAAGQPLIGMVGRLTAQKGLSLVAEAAEDIFRAGAVLVVLGSGEPVYENMIRVLAERFPEQCRAVFGYDEALSHRLIAGADFIMLPSMYEPCGLAQLYALRYGTVPIVRAVGGLNDTVRDFAGDNPEGLWDTGFKFSQFQAKAMVLAVRRAVELFASPADFQAMIQAGLKEDFSWNSSARQYLELFEKVLENTD
ncbi:MAG: glycogen synthase GlgA [Candidatus Adiutrix sp.]|jgi:starch synthase|nr:glycogen synthase GlgA [Candidatus Adiutrix sp.]